MPHLDTVQGVDKLNLFLGHLRLNDDTGLLLKIDLTYVQLVSGLSKFVFNQRYKRYSWIEWGWATSLWKFISTTQMTFDYPDMWLPTAAREGDIFLMEFFVSQRLTPTVLTQLNACCFYLQVITLSDIVSANGKYITPEAKAGQKDSYRTSTLEWPVQGRPNNATWQLWRRELAYLEERGPLIRPLGRRIAASHQQ